MATITGKPGQTVFGTNAADTLTATGTGTVYGGAGNDTINGSNAANRLYGQDGNDTIFTNGGHDEVWGGRGDDAVYGGNGGITVHGESGNDHLLGGDGHDFLDGGDGNDYLFGSGSDYLRGGPGADTITWALSGSGTGQVDGGAGLDDLFLESFRVDLASLVPNQLAVTMTGESRGTITNDGLPELNFTGINQIDDGGGDFERLAQMTYHGEHANTNMTVSAGDYGDTFIGGQGSETFIGGMSNDRFVFAFIEGGMGHDHIVNFGKGDDLPGSDIRDGLDSIAFSGDAGRLTTTQVEHDGMTTFTSSYANGSVAHVLDVDAVGLGPIGHDFFIA